MQKYEMSPAVTKELTDKLGKSASEIRQAITKASGSFESTGLLGKEVTYYDPWMGFDGREGLAKAMSEGTGYDMVSKAMNYSSLAAGTTDKTLVPLSVDPQMIDLTRRKTPLVELVSRMTAYGATAEYNRITARGGAMFQLEGSPQSEIDDTYARVSKAIKILRIAGKVSGFMQAASKAYLSQQYIDAYNLEVQMKTKSLRYAEEDAIINGYNASTRTAYGGQTTVVGAEYDGMKNLFTSTTNLSGAALKLTDIRTAVRGAATANESTTYGEGDPNLILTDFRTFDNIKAQMVDYQRFINTNFEIAWGLKTMEFEGLPVMKSKFMPVASNARELLVSSMETVQMRVLQDVTFQELPNNDDSRKFMIKVYETLVCVAPEFNWRVYTIAD